MENGRQVQDSSPALSHCQFAYAQLFHQHSNLELFQFVMLQERESQQPFCWPLKQLPVWVLGPPVGQNLALIRIVIYQCVTCLVLSILSYCSTHSGLYSLALIQIMVIAMT